MHRMANRGVQARFGNVPGPACTSDEAERPSGGGTHWGQNFQETRKWQQENIYLKSGPSAGLSSPVSFGYFKSLRSESSVISDVLFSAILCGMKHTAVWIAGVTVDPGIGKRRALNSSLHLERDV